MAHSRHLMLELQNQNYIIKLDTYTVDQNSTVFKTSFNTKGKLQVPRVS